MLDGIVIYSSNPVWRHILSELGATVTDAANVLNINFDDIEPDRPISVSELKALIVQYSDKTKILQSVFGDNVPQLSITQQNIIVSLAQSNGMTNAELKNALGYMPDVETHTIDTAIYNLRKTYGHDFIKNTNGVYTLGTI